VKIVRDVFLLVAVLAIQATLFTKWAVAGVQPDLLVAFVVYFGWMRGPIPGTLCGFTVGLIQDLDAPGPLGLNALSKTVVGFLVAKAGFRVHRSNAGVRFAFFFLAMLVHDAIYFALLTNGEVLAFLTQMAFVGLPTALLSTVVVILLLSVVERVFGRRLLADEA
jgi:rod shape-determining protein MreD